VVTINPHLYRQLGYKPGDDLRPVSQLAGAMLMLVCHPGTGIRSLKDFLARAKEQPFDYASGGAGSPSHMAMELLLSMQGLKLTHIAYRGPGPAMQDVLGGVVPCAFLASTVVGPLVKEGKLAGLGVSASARATGSPLVPTVAEAGVPGFDASFFETLFAPKDVSKANSARLRQLFADALASPATRERLLAMDLTPSVSSTAEAEARIRADSDKWGRVAQRIGLALD
jgi:tripartite-type tricarboxylate transporter receptor subunit TctC